MANMADAFLALVDATPGNGPDGDCHMWIGASKRGYGVFRYRRATHVALEMAGHTRPSRSHGALHSCDMPGCVNPLHLRWGTQKENAGDASKRNRLPNGRKTHCPKGHEYTPENTVNRKRKQGWKERHCRECDIQRKRVSHVRQ